MLAFFLAFAFFFAPLPATFLLEPFDGMEYILDDRYTLPYIDRLTKMQQENTVVTQEIASNILELSTKTGKSISAIAAELGHNPGNVHNAISRLRRKVGSVKATDEIEIVANVIEPEVKAASKKMGRKPGFKLPVKDRKSIGQFDSDRIAVDIINQLTREINVALMKASADNSQMSFVLGYALSIVNIISADSIDRHTKFED